MLTFVYFPTAEKLYQAIVIGWTPTSKPKFLPVFMIILGLQYIQGSKFCVSKLILRFIKVKNSRISIQQNGLLSWNFQKRFILKEIFSFLHSIYFWSLVSATVKHHLISRPLRPLSWNYWCVIFLSIIHYCCHKRHSVLVLQLSFWLDSNRDQWWSCE
jgi:hypothetical protein